MPDKETTRRARRDARQGKSPSTQAGEFVREEVHHIREGVHGARSAKQAIAIGLSKARRAGVALPPNPKSDVASSEAKHGTLTRERSNGSAGTRSAKRASSARGARAPSSESSVKRAKVALEALRDEPRAAASYRALARHATQSAKARGPANLHAAAEKAVATKGRTGLRAAAKKAAAARRRGR